MTYPCASCGAPYEQGRRRATPYCVDCRKTRKDANRRETSRARRASNAKASVSDVLDDYVRQGMDPDYVDMMRERIDGHLADVIHIDGPAQAAQPLEGANSPAGPEDGTSTYFTDLADDLDARHNRAAEHEWWTANPNWWVGMHDDAPIPNTAHLRTA